jgi:hypothetical protein
MDVSDPTDEVTGHTIRARMLTAFSPIGEVDSTPSTGATLTSPRGKWRSTLASTRENDDLVSAKMIEMATSEDPTVE